jgi:hypothetical protein
VGLCGVRLRIPPVTLTVMKTTPYPYLIVGLTNNFPTTLISEDEKDNILGGVSAKLDGKLVLDSEEGLQGTTALHFIVDACCLEGSAVRWRASMQM